MTRLTRIATLVLACWSLAHAQPAKTPLDLLAPLEDKNFYLLSLIERTPEARRALASDPELKKLGLTKRESLRKTIDTCNGEAACYASTLKWTDSEIATAAQRLRELYRTNAALQRLVDGPLLGS